MDLPCQCAPRSSFCLINPELDWWWWVCMPVCVRVYAFLDHSDRQDIMEIDHCGSWSRRLVCVSQDWAGFAQLRDVCMSEARCTSSILSWWAREAIRKVAGRGDEGREVVMVRVQWLLPLLWICVKATPRIQIWKDSSWHQRELRH